jgi:uncharacterized protein YecT (DUF1311 family)
MSIPSLAFRISISVLAIVAPKVTDASAEPAGATEAYKTIYERCGEKWGFPGGIAACLTDEEQVAGMRLGHAYDNALRILAPKPRAALRESQRSWLKYQENYCAILESLPSITREGPTFGKLAKAGCLLRTTLTRLDEVDALAEP